MVDGQQVDFMSSSLLLLSHCYYHYNSFIIFITMIAITIAVATVQYYRTPNPKPFQALGLQT